MELMTPSEAVIRTSEPAEEKPYVPEKKKEPEPVSFHASMKPEPADTIPLITPAEEKAEPVLKTDSGKKIELLDLDHLTAFLVSCTKADKKADDEILKKLKLNGLVNSDPEILERLDSSKEGTSLFVPVGYTKDGALTAASKAVSGEQMKALGTFARGKLQRLGTRMMSGEISETEIFPFLYRSRK